MQEPLVFRATVVPPRNNSAGRLIGLLSLIQRGDGYAKLLMGFYELKGPKGKPPTNRQYLMAFVDFTAKLQNVYAQFVNDVESPNSPIASLRPLIGDGLGALHLTIFPQGWTENIRVPTSAEIAILRHAAELLPDDGDPKQSDVDELRGHIEFLRSLAESADIHPLVKNALLEVARLASNALSEYLIYGPDSFHSAFKRMLGELMEAWLRRGYSETVQQPWWSQVVRTVMMVDGIASTLGRYAGLAVNSSRLLGLDLDVPTDSAPPSA